MQAVTTVGFDIAKSIFQVHGVNAEGQVIIRQQLRRSRVLGFFKKLSPYVVGIEACASSHHWSRELQTLGHTVRLFSAPNNSAFDPVYMKKLYQKGYEMAQGGTEWQKVPPDFKK